MAPPVTDEVHPVNVQLVNELEDVGGRLRLVA